MHGKACPLKVAGYCPRSFLFYVFEDLMTSKQSPNVYLSWPHVRSITHVYTADILKKTCLKQVALKLAFPLLKKMHLYPF